MTRGGCKLARPKGTPTPCHLCPKKSPEEASNYELSVRNQKALEFYLRMKSNPNLLRGRFKHDRIIQRNNTEFDRYFKLYDNSNLAELIAAKIAPFLAR